MARVRINVAETAEEIGVAPGGLVSIVNRGINEGWSQRQTIGVARELSLRFGDSTFRDIWRHQEAMYSRQSAVLAHPPDVPFGPEHVTQTSWGQPGKYYYWITLLRREVGSGDLIEDTSVRWSDELRSADDVVGDLMGDIDQHAEDYRGVATTFGATVYAVTQGV